MSNENTKALINSIRTTTIEYINENYNTNKAHRRYSITKSASDAAYIKSVVDDYSKKIDNILNFPVEIPFANILEDSLVIKGIDGKIIYSGSTTNNSISLRNRYNIYTSTDYSTEFNADITNSRYLFGFLSSSKFQLYAYNAASDLPETTGIYTSYIYFLYDQSSILTLRNRVGDYTRNVQNYTLFYRKYTGDTVCVYFSETHEPTELYKGQRFKTNIIYHPEKTYKITSIINTYNGEKISYNTIQRDFDVVEEDGCVCFVYNGSDYPYPYYKSLSFYGANEAYFTENGQEQSTDSTLSTGSTANLIYNKFGNLIPYNNNIRYICDVIYTNDKNISPASRQNQRIEPININGKQYLSLVLDASETAIQGFNLEYTECEKE